MGFLTGLGMGIGVRSETGSGVGSEMGLGMGLKTGLGMGLKTGLAYVREALVGTEHGWRG